MVAECGYWLDQCADNNGHGNVSDGCSSSNSSSSSSSSKKAAAEVVVV